MCSGVRLREFRLSLAGMLTALDCSNRLDDQDTGTRRGFERGRSILHSTPADPIDWYFSVETSLEGKCVTQTRF